LSKFAEFVAKQFNFDEQSNPLTCIISAKLKNMTIMAVAEDMIEVIELQSTSYRLVFTPSALN
jgi:hypothetical protein